MFKSDDQEHLSSIEVEKYKYFILSIPRVVIQFSQFPQTNAHNCHLIHNKIFKNTKFLHVILLFIIYKGESKLIIYIYKVNNKYWTFYYIFIRLYFNIRLTILFATHIQYTRKNPTSSSTHITDQTYCLVTILYKTKSP